MATPYEKTREALALLHKRLFDAESRLKISILELVGHDAWSKVEEALNTRPLNGYIGDADEQSKKYSQICGGTSCANCRLNSSNRRGISPQASCQFVWANEEFEGPVSTGQMSAEEYESYETYEE